MDTSVKQCRQIMGWATLFCAGTGSCPMELFIVSFEKPKQLPVPLRYDNTMIPIELSDRVLFVYGRSVLNPVTKCWTKAPLARKVFFLADTVHVFQCRPHLSTADPLPRVLGLQGHTCQFFRASEALSQTHIYFLPLATSSAPHFCI